MLTFCHSNHIDNESAIQKAFETSELSGGAYVWILESGDITKKDPEPNKYTEERIFY